MQYPRCSNLILKKKYMSFRTRLYRWTRGDYQILQWLNKKIENKNGVMKNNPLNLLSKYKIFCNIVRSKQETSVFLCFLFVLLMSIILKINLAFNISTYADVS